MLRAVVREELARIRPPELGIVTEVFTRDGDSSDNNHQVSLRLRASGVELQRVPVATGRLGTSLLPRVGELVVVAFAQGELNAPVVIGSLYDDERQPPVAKPDEVVYQPDDSGDASLRRLHLELPSGTTLTLGDERLELVSGGTELIVDRDGDVTVRAAGSVVIEAAGDATVEAGGNLVLSARQNVTVKGIAVTVEGQGEAKLKAASISIAGLAQFSAS